MIIVDYPDEDTGKPEPEDEKQVGYEREGEKQVGCSLDPVVQTQSSVVACFVLARHGCQLGKPDL